MLTVHQLRVILLAAVVAAHGCVLNPHGEDPSADGARAGDISMESPSTAEVEAPAGNQNAIDAPNEEKGGVSATDASAPDAGTPDGDTEPDTQDSGGAVLGFDAGVSSGAEGRASQDGGAE